MITTMMNTYNRYNHLQQMYLAKGLISGFTTALLIAVLTREVVNNFSSDIILLKNYLMEVPMLFILIPIVKRLIKDNPVMCYRIKGIVSIVGLVLLLAVETFGLSKVWYLVDSAMLSITGLLMMSHKSYYQSVVVDKCKDFSETCGYVELASNLTIFVVGISIVFLGVPTWLLLVLALPAECFERYLENRCVDIVYK